MEMSKLLKSIVDIFVQKVFLFVNQLTINTFMNFEPSKLLESNNCSRTLLFVDNNHVSQVIFE